MVNPDSIPVDEKAPISVAESPYGYTKQVCERIIRDVHASNQPLNTALLRYFNPIGAHPSSHIGELPLGHPKQPDPLPDASHCWTPRSLNGFWRRLPYRGWHMHPGLHPCR